LDARSLLKPGVTVLPANRDWHFHDSRLSAKRVCSKPTGLRLISDRSLLPARRLGRAGQSMHIDPGVKSRRAKWASMQGSNILDGFLKMKWSRKITILRAPRRCLRSTNPMQWSTGLRAPPRLRGGHDLDRPNHAPYTGSPSGTHPRGCPTIHLSKSYVPCAGPGNCSSPVASSSSRRSRSGSLISLPSGGGGW